MSFFQTKFKKEKRWICICKRINDNEDEKCAYCGNVRPDNTTKKGEPRIKSNRTDYNGMWFQSKLEANYAKQLDWRIGK